MRKIICALLALALCMSMTVTVMAAGTTFVDSITYKDSPDIDDAEQGGEDVRDCVVITSIEEAEEKSTDITQEERDRLQELYEELKNGDGKLPIDEDHVVRDLVDVSYAYEDCRKDPEHGDKEDKLGKGETLIIDFDLGIGKNDEIRVLVDKDDQWVEVKKVINNGDGTITVEFDTIGVVAFVIMGDSSDLPKTGDEAGNQLALWITLMVVSAAGVVTLVVLKTKKRI